MMHKQDCETSWKTKLQAQLKSLRFNLLDIMLIFAMPCHMAVL